MNKIDMIIFMNVLMNIVYFTLLLIQYDYYRDI